MKNQSPQDAIILAGGLGTRLRPIVSDVPKPMAPINGRPFLEILIDYWIAQGIESFTISIGYLGHLIQGHFGSIYRGKTIRYVEEKEPLGTGGGLRLVLGEMGPQDRAVVVMNGDTWYQVSLPQLFADYSLTKAPLTLTLKPIAHNDRYGSVELGEGRFVKRFGEITHGACLINGGCYLINADKTRDILNGCGSIFSFERDVLPNQAELGNLGASIQDVDFLDIGVPADYERAGHYLGKILL
jgi:D-glycero-alpha-D-manno-heptose 1-phosphate guanylyltransferase